MFGKLLLSSALTNPEGFVNILGGTNSRYDVSHGGSLPLVTLPWGFNSYAPQTDDDPTWPGWWFHPSDRRFFGLRVTHQPSPWIKDYGNFIFRALMPTVTSDNFAFTGYIPTKSDFTPYYFNTQLLAYGTSEGVTNFEFAPSNHGGIIRVKFPSFDHSLKESGYSQIRRLYVALNGGNDISQIEASPIDGTVMISGYSTTNHGGVGTADAAFAHYFVACIYNTEQGNNPTKLRSVNNDSSASSTAAWVDFHPEDTLNDVITIRFATSFISKEQALTNWKYEVNTDISFEELKMKAKSLWNSVLSRAKILSLGNGYTEEESRDLYITYYSSLYRASIFPRQLTEISSNGTLLHWSPYATSAATRVQSGEFSTDSGFWDAWNTVYPLLTLTNRPMLGATIQGWLNAYKEGGWLPNWASPGYRGSMIGNMGDVSLSDAIVNNIPGFDINLAYEAIRKDAYQVPTASDGGVGRVCLSDYLKYGYVPRGSIDSTGKTCSQIIARTLNYYQSDYAISRAAEKLGYTTDAEELYERSMNYSRVFHTASGFFRSRYIDNDQQWTTPFDEYEWGGDYTESGPWQYRFYVPHDPVGLSKLYESSGRNMCDYIEQVNTATVSTFHITGNGNEIHEQTEIPDHCWGQYAHNNQPVHHMLYMYMIGGYTNTQCSARGQYWIRKVLTELYKPDVNMFPGDEDNGEMGAWYVLSSLGLYQLSPGSGDYVLGTPLFASVEVDISDIPYTATINNNKEKNSDESNKKSLRGDSSNNSKSNTNKKTLLIEAVNNSKENKYVQSIYWNHELLDRNTVNTISYNTLAQGGVLTFVMGSQPFVITEKIA